ncbi:MAG: PQQ-binding-like beta-propeller repeat protein [Planctomycetaceae bacterium]
MPRFLVFACVGLLGLALLVTATRAGVVSGVVKSTSPDAGRITIETKDGRSKSFTIPQGAELTIDDRTAAVDALQAGHKVSVFVGANGAVTKVRARSEEPAAVEPATSNSPAAGSTRTANTQPAGRPPIGWPQYGGPLRDNRSGDTGLLGEWPTDGPPLSLRVAGLGVGYSSVSLADGKIFTMGSVGEDEFVIALDEKTGDDVWKVRIGATRKDGMGDGPRGTPTIDEDRVYALGANGDLVCLSINDGYAIWKANILEKFGGNNIGWGISESVLIDGDHLICTPGGKQATMAALDKRTGKVVWKCKAPETPPAAYSSAIAVELNGVRQYVNFTHTGVIGVQADNGDFLWSNSASANGTANCSSPVAYDGNIFSSSGYGQGCALVKITEKRGRDGAKLVYKNEELRSHHGGIVLDGQYVYGTDEGVMKCLDVLTGETKWQNRSVGKGAVVYADGKIILRSEQGPIALLDATPDEYREHGRFEQPDRSGQAAWAHPVVADGKLFLRDQGLLLVYDLRAK